MEKILVLFGNVVYIGREKKCKQCFMLVCERELFIEPLQCRNLCTGHEKEGNEGHVATCNYNEYEDGKKWKRRREKGEKRRSEKERTKGERMIGKAGGNIIHENI